MSTSTRTRPTLRAAAAAALAACGSTPSTPPATGPTVAATTAAPTSAATATVAPTGGQTKAPTSVPSGGGVPNCATGELKGSVGPGDGAAGSVYVPIYLTNSGVRTCELRGFPGVSYVAGADGHQVGAAAAMSGERGGEVVLRPGARATTQLQLVDVQNFDPAACRPTPVRGLRVYPPGDTTSLYIERPGTGCAADVSGNQIRVKTLAPA